VKKSDISSCKRLYCR